ncbi:MAG: Biotin carboxyl carrier protein of acetyl-CoA carboxylase [Myxococcales bacterium]|nr:Biotin carboxyl carrier protein of acetyl-CoA carboxylase [Myxococcales bacterium]
MRAKGKKPAPSRATVSSLSSSSSSASSQRSPSSIEARVDALAEVLRRHELNEIEIEEDGVRIYVRRGGGEVVQAATSFHHAPPPTPHAPPPTASGSTAQTQGSSTDTGDGNVAYVTSPFVGTFYRAPSPDMAPFVDVGTRIKKGQVICIVEAMKLMNEIESEIEGSIVQLLVENGQAVEYGEPLFKIKVG